MPLHDIYIKIRVDKSVLPSREFFAIARGDTELHTLLTKLGCEEEEMEVSWSESKALILVAVLCSFQAFIYNIFLLRINRKLIKKYFLIFTIF